MSNILIIKHGSLGDIAQISGVLRDIREFYKEEKIFLLSTSTYADLLSRCPYIDGVLIDKRLPRWNLFYLFKLKKLLDKFDFTKIIDLQNSSRTSFYRKYLLKKKKWSSSEINLNKNTKIDSVLHRFKEQLEFSDIKTKYTLTPNFSWACININEVLNKYFDKKFILIFPLCSPKLKHKQWPYYNILINKIKSEHKNLEIAIAPGPNEIELAENFNAVSILNKNKPLNISELAGLIKKSSFIIANDTGPAHMSAHLQKDGIVLFGKHTTPEKVSIETNNFKAIKVDNLINLTSEKVYNEIKNKIDLIFN
jgi:ADP-heptose:LPS heptosyltransferase